MSLAFREVIFFTDIYREEGETEREREKEGKREREREWEIKKEEEEKRLNKLTEMKSS